MTRVTSTTVLWRFPRLATESGLAHGVTLGRANMSDSVGPDPGGTARRRRDACEQLGVPFDRLAMAEQVHGCRIAVVDESHDGRGSGALSRCIDGVDGLLCDIPSVPIMVQSADCCLVLVYDPAGRAIGVVHAGWRGTAAGITRLLVRRMSDCFGAVVGRLMAGIGPAARGCCYEVGKDVVEAFRRNGLASACLVDGGDGSTRLDLLRANWIQLCDAGVAPSRIEALSPCNICERDSFSYRREGATTGRFALFAALR